jgi:hypothetical protein
MSNDSLRLHVPGFSRRHVLLAGALGALALPLRAAPAGAPLVEVWKDPSCGCCGDWMRHLEAHGFRTQVHAQGNAAQRARMGVAPQYGACHTAVVDGYAIEGHVPAREIHRLLKERPAVIGLAVPGMPIGSPGMDGPSYGGRRDPYTVLLLDKQGGSSVFQAYG